MYGHTLCEVESSKIFLPQIINFAMQFLLILSPLNWNAPFSYIKYFSCLISILMFCYTEMSISSYVSIIVILIIAAL